MAKRTYLIARAVEDIGVDFKCQWSRVFALSVLADREHLMKVVG